MAICNANPRLLIVEDQKCTLESLEHAVRTVGKRHLPGMTYDIARCYDEARKMIQEGYAIILLDHRMPIQNPGDMEEQDFNRFCDSLENIGYSLIPEIKRIDPQTLVIGTSSLSDRELRGQTKPDHCMSKMWGEAEKDLDIILTAYIKDKV